MKKILCYGDSNTFGFNPVDASRFDEQTRWTSLLQQNLGNEYNVTEEGACDRTGFVNNSKGFLFSAQQHFPKLISAVSDINILILSVGTNDLQFKYNISNEEIQTGLENLINLAKAKVNNIIIIPSVILSENILDGYFKIQFDKESIEKSLKTGEIYRAIAKKYNCYIFDFNEIVSPSLTDGLHYDEKAHKLIAEKLTKYIKDNF